VQHLLSFQVVSDQVACHPFHNLADDIQEADHPIGPYLRVVGLSGVWNNDSFGCFPEFGVMAQPDAGSD